MRTYRIHGKEHEVNEEQFRFNIGTILNEKATLREVKEKVGSSRKFKRSPGIMYLRSCGNLVAATTTAGCRMEVYDNGFAIYQTRDRATVIRMEYVGRCFYEGKPEIEQGNQSIDLSDEVWIVAVMMKGEEQLEKRRGERATNKPVLLCDAGAYDEESGENTEIEMNADKSIEKYIMSDEEKARLWNRMSGILTRRQKKIMELFYSECLSKQEISDRLGMDNLSVTLTLQRAKKTIQSKLMTSTKLASQRKIHHR